MEKNGTRRRDIRFYSAKNDSVVLVHTQAARDYAKRLDSDQNVQSYVPGYPLNRERYQHISPVGIRKTYFETEWATDFFVTYSDGSTAAIELARQDDLRKRACVEKLEFSRRYWAEQDIGRWAVALVGGES